MEQVIIVGAGLAGAAAAYRLNKSGIRSLVIEAQDRIGGRAFSRPHGSSPVGGLVEFGGSWITPYHARIRAHVAELGLKLRPRAPVTQRLAFRDGETAAPYFISPEERQAHERVIARIAADAMLLKMGHALDESGRPLTGVTFKDYLTRINPPQATRNMLAAWWTTSGSGAHDVVAASEFISSCAYGGGLAENMIDVWSDTVEPGMGVLAARLLAASGAELRMSCPIVSITQHESGVTLTTRDGENLSAPHVIVAVGVNAMGDIKFVPELSGPRAVALARGHGGKAFKLLIKARGVSVGTLITGDGTGIQLLFAERAADDGATLLIGFGLQLDHARPQDEGWVREEFKRLVPNAEFISYDWHDWINDPFAQGTWVAAPADIADAFSAEAWRPEGRIAFATSDIAAEQAGWFEGAVRSGEAAADWVAGRIDVAPSTE
ncbi:MAG: NAD(P)/FAD-dependent oxidoreductase [Aestuariivirga sp.]